MRPCILLLTLLVVLAGCKPEDTPAALRMVRTLVVDTKRINEDRQAIGEAKLLKDGWTPRATYDTALQNLQAAEARLKAAKANLDLTHDQLNYTTLKADFD